ncbi:MAG TPA: hypothetical protein VH857_13810 [Actinomycetes bacterium]|nr:hypothetical protein [Actinomycetes bacterium]
MTATALHGTTPAQPIATGGWRLDVAESALAFAVVGQGAAGLQVRLGEGSEPAAPARAASFLVADLDPDGAARVVTSCAPPALLMSASSVRLLPADGTGRGAAVLDTGDLLVMGSATILDDEPDRWASLLRTDPEEVRGRTENLALALLRHSSRGASVVARRLPPTA